MGIKYYIKLLCIYIIIIFFGFYCKKIIDCSKITEVSFIKGADISFLNEIEDRGGVYYDEGVEKDALRILKDNGINYIRLRIWNDPSAGYCSKEKTLCMAKRIKRLGMKFLLNFHYSDNWADPKKQTKPWAWQSLSFGELKQAVYGYTKEVITELKKQNTLPDMVQIGNEVIWGMLWDDGRVGGYFDTDEQWSKFTDLLKVGILAVRDCLCEGEVVKIMIHAHVATDNEQCRWFIDNLISRKVDFDIIGLSYYPWWPEFESLTKLRDNMNDLAQRYGKDINIVETAYPWTLSSYDDTPNHFNSRNPNHQLMPDYPATAAGQGSFLKDLMTAVKNVSNGKGSGIFYWSPEWISIPEKRSDWENLTLFDFNGNALASLKSFKMF